MSLKIVFPMDRKLREAILCQEKFPVAKVAAKVPTDLTGCSVQGSSQTSRSAHGSEQRVTSSSGEKLEIIRWMPFKFEVDLRRKV